MKCPTCDSELETDKRGEESCLVCDPERFESGSGSGFAFGGSDEESFEFRGEVGGECGLCHELFPYDQLEGAFCVPCRDAYERHEEEAEEEKCTNCGAELPAGGGHQQGFGGPICTSCDEWDG